MPKIHEGKLDATGKRVAIVASRFNEFVTKRLLDGAIDCLLRHGLDDAELDVFWVPGAFEVPQMALRISSGTAFDGILCLGALIRGDTAHFDVLSTSVARSIDRVATKSSIPVSFGFVTADSMEQAIERAGAKRGNRGWQSALSLIEMMRLWEGQ